MACLFIKTENAEIIMCGLPDAMGRFLFWTWELKKYTGVAWFISYPRIEWIMLWETIKEVKFKFFQYRNMWMSWREDNFIPGERNPLWSWFHLQWKLKKLYEL